MHADDHWRLARFGHRRFNEKYRRLLKAFALLNCKTSDHSWNDAVLFWALALRDNNIKYCTAFSRKIWISDSTKGDGDTSREHLEEKG